MSKTMILAAALALSAGAAFADHKDGINDNSNAQGSDIGVFSSRVTGNGAAIGGGTNGTGQTTEPGSRAALVQAILAAKGRGRDAMDDTENTDE